MERFCGCNKSPNEREALSVRAATIWIKRSRRARDTKFHRLTVKVDRPGLELHYRLGYYRRRGPVSRFAKKALIEAVLLSPPIPRL